MTQTHGGTGISVWWGRPVVVATIAVLALAMIGSALWRLTADTAGLRVERTHIGSIPATVREPAAAAPGPAVIIAHGFAGSRQLMQPFAIALAREGYTTIAFDFPGHGQNPEPMRGDVTAEDGATRYLLDALDAVAAYGRERTGLPEVALLGHSMASDIIVRQAIADPQVRATVAVSMFSPAVTAQEPGNLLVVVGDLEPAILKDEALRVVELIADGPVEPGTTVGDLDAGTARRAFFAPGVEHIGVLYQTDGIGEAAAWIDRAFGRDPETGAIDARGPWILLLLTGTVLLAWPASRLLPRLATPRDDNDKRPPMPWRRVLTAAALPSILTPLILWPLPTDFLPVLVGGYLMCHFALHGLLTLGALAWLDGRADRPGLGMLIRPAGALTVGVVTLFVLLAVGGPLETFVASFWPVGDRWGLLAVMLLGTLPFFFGQAWLSSGTPWAWARGLAGRVAFILSLALAIALDLESLFFLIILTPVILLFFVIFGFFGRLVTARTGHPFVAATANAVALAWSIAVTFPMLAGGG